MISFKQYLSESEVDEMHCDHFYMAVSDDPAWCSRLTRPLLIRGPVDLSGNKITHLSPLLTFNLYTTFSNCKHLEVAAGKFKHGVNFTKSSISKIQDLEVWGFPHDRVVAQFIDCENLRIAEGTFHGNVDFSYSGITKIGNLNITKPSMRGAAANFSDCARLEVATGTYPGSVDFIDSGVADIIDLKVTGKDSYGVAASFSRCDNLTYITGEYGGRVNLINTPIDHIRDLTIVGADRKDRALSLGKHPIKSVSNFKYVGKLDGNEENVKRVYDLMGQEKAGGKGEFDDLF